MDNDDSKSYVRPLLQLETVTMCLFSAFIANKSINN